MAVMIEDMTMPKRCMDCALEMVVEKRITICSLSALHISGCRENGRPQNCPLMGAVEIPDAVSRQEAIDALGEEPEVYMENDEYAQGLNNQWRYDVNALKALPSAQPEQEREFIKLTVRESNGRPYYSIIYLEVDENGVGHDFEGYSSYDLDFISDYLKRYFGFGTSVQPEKRTDKRTETHSCDSISRQAVLDKAYAYGNGYEPDGFCVDVEDIQALPSVQPKKGYTKADYIMALHKEYGCDLTRAEKAHDKALEYLRDTAILKG